MRDGTRIRVPSTHSSTERRDNLAVTCERCGTVVTGKDQALTPTVWIPTWNYCACMQEALAVAEEARRAEEAARQARLAQNRWYTQQREYEAIFPQWRDSARVSAQTLAAFRVTPGTRTAWTHIQQWLAGDLPAEGFMLTGAVGTGKTHLVRGVVHALFDRLVPVVYTSVPFLLERLRDPRRDAPTMEEMLRMHVRAPVVVWDDLGAERPTEWTLDRLYLLVDARYEARKPLLTTTNWTPQALEERLGARIVSRLLEMGPVLEVSGPDVRVEKARARLTQETRT